MIIRIQKAGHSFKGLANYLTENKERVAWTRSLNCAHDDVASVVHEMYSTYDQAELLKDQAGAHGGGTVLERPVKHISLNWHPSEHPTQEEMIAAAESFLKEMGWDEHQALLVSHSDKPHPHVHIELNRVHPETGLGLNDAFERRRASDWALDYERENGLIRCEQRLLEPEDRTPNPSRETWESLREAEQKYNRDEIASFERMDGYFTRKDKRETIETHEWAMLKDHQREERENFFAEGKLIYKQARNDVYHEVREMFREDWAQYHAAVRGGISMEERDLWRASILELQREAREELKTEAFTELRESRDAEYKELLVGQRSDRHTLHEAQNQGERSYDLLTLVGHEATIDTDLLAGTSANENETLTDKATEATEPDRAELEHEPIGNGDVSSRVKGVDGIADLGLGALGALATFMERLFDSFLGPAPPKSKTPAPEPEPHAREQREAARLQRVEAAIRAAEEDRERQQDDTYWRDRQRSRG